VAIEDAQEAPDDMLGTFLVNATTAIVLFGARASHSFISATYIEKHNLPISMLKCRGWGGGCKRYHKSHRPALKENSCYS
jgi:hypothetical protein